jgi:hypothetical protein
MRKRIAFICTMALAAVVPALGLPQKQINTLVLVGHAGNVPVMQIRGKNYVEVEALAHLADGSVSYSGPQITLSLPPASGPEDAGPAENGGFSKDFLRAAIESLSTIREWHSALASAIENQFPVVQSWLATHEARAMTSLSLAQVAATTDDDRGAAQLLANAVDRMRQLSENYVGQRADLSYIAPDSLQNDKLDQRTVTCGRSLAAMFVSGQFVDEAACH